MSSRSKKVIRLCMRFSSVPNRSVQQHPQAPISKSTPLYSAASFFFKEFLNPQVRIKKWQMQNSMAPFLDGVKLSQDYRATTRRLLPKMHLRQNRNFQSCTQAELSRRLILAPPIQIQLPFQQKEENTIWTFRS